jgi:type IX secretion system PorP/SprF family membrane protein
MLIRKLVAFVLLLQCTITVAQQDAQYTQWMFNKLSLNPAYSVSSDNFCVSCLHRSQWEGLEGAPVSQSLNARIPFYKKRVGLGISINNDQIGPTSSWSFSGIYGYRIDLNNNAKLGVGLQGTLRNYRVKYSETFAVHSGDGVLPQSDFSKMVPNFGGGLYFYTPKVYIGLSMPRFIEQELTPFDAASDVADFSREARHAYLMAGVVFDLNQRVKLKPAVLIKYADNSPLDADLHASLIFFDRFWAGLTYRTGGSSNSIGESLDVITQVQIGKSVRLGFAFDFTLSKLRDYNDGTYELVLDYCMSSAENKMTNPRFF